MHSAASAAAVLMGTCTLHVVLMCSACIELLGHLLDAEYVEDCYRTALLQSIALELHLNLHSFSEKTPSATGNVTSVGLQTHFAAAWDCREGAMVKQRMTTADVAGEVACLRQRVLGMRVANLYDLNSKVSRSDSICVNIIVVRFDHHSCRHAASSMPFGTQRYCADCVQQFASDHDCM